MADTPTSTEYHDANYYAAGNNKTFDFRMIVLLHLNKIQQLQCKEWHGGYTDHYSDTTQTGTTEITKYVPDSRAEYINAVIGLYNLLQPYITSYQPKKKNKTDHNKKVTEAYLPVEELFMKKNLDQHPHQNILRTHELLRTLVGFMKEINFLAPKAISDIGDDDDELS